MLGPGDTRPGKGFRPFQPEQQPAADRIGLGEPHRHRIAERELRAGAAPDQAVQP